MYRPSVGWTELLHPEDVDGTVYAAATGEPYVVEHRVRRFDGSYRWFRVSAVRVRNPKTEELRWYGAVRQPRREGG